MKKVFILSLFIPAMAGAQGPAAPFTLVGRLGNYNAPAKVYFDHMEGDVAKTDSAVLVDGAFRFSGQLPGPSAVRMSFTPRGDGKERAIYTGDVIYFYIGSENILIASKDSLAGAVITGSAINDQYEAYNKFIGGSIMALTKAVNADFNSGTEEQKKDTAYMGAVDRRYRQNLRNRNDKQLEFARQHPSSYFSLIALSELISSPAQVAATEPVFAGLNESLRLSPLGKELAGRITAFTSIVPGALAPDFTQNDVNGQPITLSKLRGQYVLVDFWASWCGPCRAENPNLSKQYQLYKGNGFQVLSVSLDDNKGKWKDAIAKDGMPWLHVSDLQGWNNAAGKLYGVRGVPASFLVDPQGKIVGTGLRGEDLNKKLQELFKK